MLPLAFDWTSVYGIALAVALAVTTFSGAAAIVWKMASSIKAWKSPPEPLFSFGHPSENAIPWVFAIGGEDEWERQERRYEGLRLSSLSVSYLIENKDTTAFLNVETGLRSRDSSGEYVHKPCFVQILEPGRTVEVPNVEVPCEMHEGMTDEDRAVNFLYWARFTDAKQRRWQAAYDPQTRRRTFTLLSR